MLAVFVKFVACLHNFRNSLEHQRWLGLRYNLFFFFPPFVWGKNVVDRYRLLRCWLLIISRIYFKMRTSCDYDSGLIASMYNGDLRLLSNCGPILGRKICKTQTIGKISIVMNHCVLFLVWIPSICSKWIKYWQSISGRWTRMMVCSYNLILPSYYFFLISK